MVDENDDEIPIKRVRRSARIAARQREAETKSKISSISDDGAGPSSI